MAAARDQAARIVRAETGGGEGETARERPRQLPSHVAEEANAPATPGASGHR